MQIPTVPGATIRGTTYHFDLPIPVMIRVLRGGRKVRRGTMATSDPKDATRQITADRALFDRQIEEAQRKTTQARLKKFLDPADAAIVEALGDSGSIPPTIADLRKQAVFLLAGRSADAYDDAQDFPEGIQRDLASWCHSLRLIPLSGAKTRGA